MGAITFITSKTGNSILDNSSTGIRYLAGCTLTTYALWKTNYSIIASIATTIGATALMFQFLDDQRSSKRSPPKSSENSARHLTYKAISPLLLGVTSATIAVAAIRLYQTMQQISNYLTEQGLTLWRVSLEIQGSHEQLQYIRQLMWKGRIEMGAMMINLAGLCLQGVVVLSNNSDRKL